MKIWAILGISISALGVAMLPEVGEEVIALVKELPPDKWQQEVQTIDEAVVKLTDLRNKELSNAAWAQNQGDRLQFQSQNLMDAKRYWNEADASREIASRYQEEIDKLEARKKEILKQQGIEPSPS
jgi:multidrug efflux pump subunit AcrB